MNSITTKALVVSSINYKEKDKLLTLFTLDYGLMTVSARGVKTKNAKLKFAKEIFCFGEWTIAKPSNIATSVNVEESFFDVTKDLDKFYCGCAILEVVKTCASYEEQNPLLFVQLLKAIGTICYDSCNSKYVLVKFLLEVFKAMGYPLNFEKCNVCGEKFCGKTYLSVEFGEIVCGNCKNYKSVEISPRCLSAFKILMQTPYEKLCSVKLASGSEDEAFCALNAKFFNHFNKKLVVL